MQLPSLLPAQFIKRYKRFFIDAKLLDTNEMITAHCPNTGSMQGLLNEHTIVYVSNINNPKAKLKYKAELVENDNTLTGINTITTNKIIAESLANQQITDITNIKSIYPEKTFNKARLDFQIIHHDDTVTYLEVKNVTLKRTDNIAEFPDAITSRGSKHLHHLMQAVDQGHKAINLYLAQRNDVTSFQIAKDLDAQYAKDVIQARQHGVKIISFACQITLSKIQLGHQLNVI